jgi:RNA polymerase sigma factor (sigma-70 family)
MKAMSKGDDWFCFFREGDQNAFEKAFGLYYRPVIYYAMKILHEDSYAEDIVSESFNKAWNNREKLETARHFENFLYMVTRNACLSYIRSDRIAQITEKEWWRMFNQEREGYILDVEKAHAELIEKINCHLEKLSGGQIVRMSYLEGKSTKEIASQLKITENIVYITKHRSLKALRSMLEGAK